MSELDSRAYISLGKRAHERHPQIRPAETGEISLLLRWAAAPLNPTERFALGAFAIDATQVEAARELGISRSGVFKAQRSGLAKTRRRLSALGIKSSADLLTGGES